MSQQGQQQEMIYKEQKQPEQVVEQNNKQKQEELKFGGGEGGPGKPFRRSGSHSSFQQIVCRPDPNNPGQQICKKIIKETVIDPETGKKTVRNTENEETLPFNHQQDLFGHQGPSFFNPYFQYQNEPSFFDRIQQRFFGNHDYFRNQQANNFYDYQNNQQPQYYEQLQQNQNENSFKSRGSEYFKKLKNIFYFGEKQNDDQNQPNFQPAPHQYAQQYNLVHQPNQQQYSYYENNQDDSKLFDNLQRMQRNLLGGILSNSFIRDDDFLDQRQDYRFKQNDIFDEIERDFFGLRLGFDRDPHFIGQQDPFQSIFVMGPSQFHQFPDHQNQSFQRDFNFGQDVRNFDYQNRNLNPQYQHQQMQNQFQENKQSTMHGKGKIYDV